MDSRYGVPVIPDIGRPCGCEPHDGVICHWHCQFQGCTDDGEHTAACIAGERLTPERPCPRCGCIHDHGCLTCSCTCDPLPRQTCPCCKASDEDITGRPS